MTSEPIRFTFAALPAPGGAGGGNDHDVVGLEQFGGEPGRQRQQGRRRVAAGDGDPGGALEGFALAREFRQPVGPRSGVGGAVELFPRRRILEAVVCAGVDHHGAFGKLRRNLGGRAVRERQEHDVVTGKVFHRGVFEDAAGQPVQVRLEFAESGARIAVRSDGTDGHVRMAREQAQNFSSGVAAGPGDGNRNSHGQDLTAKVFIAARYLCTRGFLPARAGWTRTRMLD